MKKIAVISAILDEPKKSKEEFNSVVAEFRGSIKGRMGIPFDEGISVISLTVTGEMEEINKLATRLENVEGASVKTAISRKEI